MQLAFGSLAVVYYDSPHPAITTAAIVVSMYVKDDLKLTQETVILN